MIDLAEKFGRTAGKNPPEFFAVVSVVELHTKGENMKFTRNIKDTQEDVLKTRISGLGELENARPERRWNGRKGMYEPRPASKALQYEEAGYAIRPGHIDEVKKEMDDFNRITTKFIEAGKAGAQVNPDQVRFKLVVGAETRHVKNMAWAVNEAKDLIERQMKFNPKVKAIVTDEFEGKSFGITRDGTVTELCLRCAAPITEEHTTESCRTPFGQSNFNMAFGREYDEGCKGPRGTMLKSRGVPQPEGIDRGRKGRWTCWKEDTK